MNKLFLMCGVLILALTACNTPKTADNNGPIKLTTKLDSVSYAIGISIGQNMVKDGLDSIDVDMLARAMKSSLGKKDSLLLTMPLAQTVIQSYVQSLQTKKFEPNKAAGAKYLEENKKKPGVITTASGLQYKIIKEGTGPKPKLTDTVTTHYHGTLIDGTVFDSSVDRKQPISFSVHGVIPGWTEALQLMPMGSKWQLVIPENLAYGEHPQPGSKIQPFATLIFDLELLDIKPGK